MSLPAQGRVVSICIALRGKIGWGNIDENCPGIGGQIARRHERIFTAGIINKRYKRRYETMEDTN